MLNYIRNTDIAIRLSLNPLIANSWLWLPQWSYDGPTPIFPKRKTYFVGWLFFQLFLDIDDGTLDPTKVPSWGPFDNITVKNDD